MSVAGFVLAGGRSSRMGLDKALLPLSGGTMVQAIAAEVEAAAGRVAMIGDPHVYRSLNYPVYPDTTPGCGPISGLEAVLLLDMAEWNLIVACDMPRVRSYHLIPLLDELAASEPTTGCVVPVTPEGPQPLCSIYRRSVLPAIQAAMGRGQYGLRRLLPELSPRWHKPVDPGAFLNVNTPEDWEAYRSSL